MVERVDLNDFMNWVVERNPGEEHLHQAMREVAEAVLPFVNANPVYAKVKVLHRLAEPDRIISFRVAWADDNHDVQVNRGFRVQFNNSIGPYKGGIRFHPSVNQGVLKFLGFEQTFKNSLTGLPMGGADFDPKGRSQHEIMTFCQAYERALPAHRRQHRCPGRRCRRRRARDRLHVRHLQAAGKGLEYGGSLMRPEATGYGAVYFLECMLRHRRDCTKGKTAVISGSGNVATHAAEKLCHRGGKPITLSDSDGFIHDPDGITEEKTAWVKQHKKRRGNRISAYVDEFEGATFHEGEMPWGVPCDLALPCATENELNGDDAKMLLANGCMAVAEGANMPCTADAVRALQEAQICYAPGKASNAGGVAMWDSR